MHLKEIDRRLDTDLEITFNKDAPVLKLSRSLNYTLQAFFEIKENQKVCSVFIPKEKVEIASESVKFLSSTTENEGFVIASIPIEEAIYGVLESLSSIPTTSSFDITVRGGYLKVSLRFHHGAIQEISRELGKREEIRHLVNNIRIQPSNGIIAWYEHRSLEFPIWVLEYSIPFREVKGKIARSLFEKGAIAQSAAIFTNSSDQRMIFHLNGSSKVNVKPSYPDSRIYEMPFSRVGLETFSILNNVFNAQKLKRFNVFFKKDGVNLNIIVFVQKYDAMTHIAETFGFFNKSKIPVDLVFSREYGPDIWELI